LSGFFVVEGCTGFRGIWLALVALGPEGVVNIYESRSGSEVGVDVGVLGWN
jgi:hypothetical protein